MLARAVRLAAALCVVVFGMGNNCFNPCQQLADKICACQPTEAERQACTREAQTQADQRTLSNDDRLFCQQAWRTCECRALEEGRLEQCGLSRE